MTPTHVELSSATVLARPSATVAAPQVTPAVIRGELARGMSTSEHATARSALVLAQVRPGGGPGVPMRPMPVPPNRGGVVGGGYVGGGYVGGGYVGGGYAVAPSYGYAQPGYGYGYGTPGYGYGVGGTGLSLGLTFGNGQTSLWAGAGPAVGQQYYGQVAPYDILMTDGYRNRWIRAGQQIPPGWVQQVPTWWDNIFTPYLY